MLYDPKLTAAPFDGILFVKRRHKLISNADGMLMGTLSKRHVLDLNGKEIAVRERDDITIDEDKKKRKCRVYTSPKGEMVLCDGVLFLSGKPIGKIPARERRASHITILGIAALMLLAIFALIWLIDIPSMEVPTIKIADKDGEWGARGTIAVLDSSIAPDSSGEYEFVLENPHDVSIAYQFSIKEYVNNKEVNDFPLEFRIRMNNVLLESEEWVSAENLNFSNLVIMPKSASRFTLEWRWQYEGGNDELDTYFGQLNAEYHLEFYMTAQTSEEE